MTEPERPIRAATRGKQALAEALASARDGGARDGGARKTPRGCLLSVPFAVVVVIAVLAFGGVFLAGFRSTPVDQIGLHYTGGPIEGTKFAGFVNPGSGKRFLGLMDKLVLLPTTQRDYIASDEPSSDGPAILAPARGGVEMRFETAAYFALNTGPVAQVFYERVCVKFRCDTEAGWDEMLRVNFRKPIEQAVQQSIREYTVNELYAGKAEAGASTDEEATAILVQVQDQIAADLKDNINSILGGDYFCGPTFDRLNPEVCPDFQFQIISAVPTSDAVRAAFADNAASQQRVVTAQNEAQAAVAVAEGQRRSQEALQGVYTDPNYIAYLNALALQDCAKNSNCTLVVTPDGTGTNINVGSP